MSELQFPKDPIVGQEYDFAPYKYYWDGTKWKTKGIGYNPVNDLRDELEPRISNNESKVFEALRRSYAAAGLNLVEGSFEEGGELLVASDVLITASGDGYSWSGTFPKTVEPGTDPVLTVGFVHSYSPEAPTGGDGESAKEALRRSYADAGLTVKGYTDDGATLSTVSDVVIHNATGKGYSWGGVLPHTVTPGTDPTAVGSGYVPRTDILLRSELIDNGPLSVRSGKLSLRDFVSVKDYGAIGDGETDDTVAIQAALDANYAVYFPSGVYKVSSITVRTGKKIYGDGNKHLYLRGSGGITLAQVKQLGGSWLYGTSLTTPAINAACVKISAGLHIEGLCFYQDHEDYSSPTDYPCQISDENSTAYWSGVTIKNCMFINSNQGIKLMKAERSDITDINADFFRRGIHILQSNDASRMNRIHVWNFSGSTLADAFKQSEQSHYAIYINDVDEIFISDIAIWNRMYGIYTNKMWGTLNSITLDTVGVPIVINSPIGFATTVSNAKINANNAVAHQRAAIRVTGSASDAASLIIDGVSCWQGSIHKYGPDSTIEIDCEGLTCGINNINHKYANKAGVLITNAKEVSLRDHKFQNYFPNQSPSVGILSTVGIRNESATCKLSISGIRAGVLRYLFDGYYDFTEFLDTRPSLISTNQAMQSSSGTITASGVSDTNGKRYFRYSNDDSSGAYTGLRCVGGIKNNPVVRGGSKCVIGAVYKNITAIDAHPMYHRFISFWSYSGGENYLVLDTALHTATRCTIQTYVPSGTGNIGLGTYGQTLNGTVDIYGVWMCDTDLIAVGFDDNNNNYLSSAPTSTACYHLLGDSYKNKSPTASGYSGWVCTSSGSPGTWKTYGAISG